MPNPYLQSADYPAFGITDAQAYQVDQASRNIDSYLGRPEGLLWSTDANGQPAWMTGLTPTRAFTLPQSISPGTGVQVTIPYAQFGYQNIGDVVILDRANSLEAEACVISAASGNTLTFDNVQFAHAAQATMEFGLTILHESKVRMTPRRIIRLAQWPLAQVISSFGRFIYDPRGSQLSHAGRGPLLLEELALIGTSPGWTEFSLSDCDINYETGIVTILPGLPQYGFNEVRMRYVAGWQYATLPEAIKRATANMVRSAIDTPFSANMKVLKSGDGTMERFGPGIMDMDTKALLQPYKSMRI